MSLIPEAENAATLHQCHSLTNDRPLSSVTYTSLAVVLFFFGQDLLDEFPPPPFSITMATTFLIFNPQHEALVFRTLVSKTVTLILLTSPHTSIDLHLTNTLSVCFIKFKDLQRWSDQPYKQYIFPLQEEGAWKFNSPTRFYFAACNDKLENLIFKKK